MPLATVILAALLLAAPPADTSTMTIDFGVRVPMRDGVTLAGDVYRPRGPGRYPVVLARTPYNKNGDGTLRAARALVARGYAYVVVDVRGRGDSDGEWRPYRHEGIDGYDTIEWCAGQPWSTGKVGTIGASYQGYNQWLAAVEQPPHLAAMIVLAAMTDPFGDVWISGPGGLPTPTMISWYHLTADHVLQNMNAIDWARLNEHVPLMTMDVAAGRPNPHWREIIAHSRLDEWWDPTRYQNRWERVTVPVLHLSGWYDDAQRATPMNFTGVRRQGGSELARRNQKMVIGPWPHQINSTSKLGPVDFGPTAVIDLVGLEGRWFDRWLKGTENGIDREPPVRLFAMKANRWFDAADWPVPGTEFTTYYLRSGGHANGSGGDGRLLTMAPGEEPPDRYEADPANAVPFLTEPSYAQLGGPEDYRAVHRRRDLLVFDSPPFRQATLVCGPLAVRLFAASSARDTDFMAKVLDVWPTGYAQRLNDGMVRARFRNGPDRSELIEPDRVYQYQIDAWNTCQTFQPGHRVRLEIASAAFPKFDRNPNTGDSLGVDTGRVVARQAVYHDSRRPSALILPIVPAGR